MSREKATKFIVENIDALLPGSPNTALIKKRLKGLTDDEFEKLMGLFERGEDYVQMVVPNSAEEHFDNEKVIEVGEKLGIKFLERVWITDQTSGLLSLSRKPATTFILPNRRQSQTRNKKSSTASDSKHVDELTGQPTGDSKTDSIGFPQLLIFESRGLRRCAEECVKVRGGDNTAFNASNKIIHQTGTVSLERLRELGSRAKSNEVLSAFLTAEHLKNNL